jgi:hypothetical protein
MTNWFRVLNLLKAHCPPGVETIEDALLYLYVDKRLSLREIKDLTDREVLGPQTIRSKLVSIGVDIKSRGGPNSRKVIPLKLEEFKEFSVAELAKKYNVHKTTIYNKKRTLQGGK